MKKGEPNLPDLAKGQQYNVKCCACGSKALARGTVQILEPEGEPTWSVNELIVEHQCDRATCKQVSYLVLRYTREGVVLQWRSYRASNVKTVVNA